MCYICRLIRSLKTIMVLKTTLLAMILVYSFWTDTTLAGSSFLSPEQPRTQVSISGYYFAAITLFQVYPTHSLLLTKHSYLALICFQQRKLLPKPTPKVHRRDAEAFPDIRETEGDTNDIEIKVIFLCFTVPIIQIGVSFVCFFRVLTFSCTTKCVFD